MPICYFLTRPPPSSKKRLSQNYFGNKKQIIEKKILATCYSHLQEYMLRLLDLSVGQKLLLFGVYGFWGMGVRCSWLMFNTSMTQLCTGKVAY